MEERGKQLVAEKPLDKQEEIFYQLVAERTGKIEKLHKSFDFENLIHYFKGSAKDIDFNDFMDAETHFDGKIKILI